MTPEQAARFVLSDGQDPELRALVDREMEAQLAESLKDPAFKARWDANLRAFADDIDRRIAESVYRDLNMT